MIIKFSTRLGLAAFMEHMKRTHPHIHSHFSWKGNTATLDHEPPPMIEALLRKVAAVCEVAGTKSKVPVPEEYTV